MRHYALVLRTTQGLRRSLRINNPDPNLPHADIVAAVDKLIANDVFEPSRGVLDSVHRLELTHVQTDVLI